MKQLPGHRTPALNMAEELLEVVERLQSRLSENLEPRKLLKTLKRLGELPMTVDILVETGVGKTVNSFRKHDLAGDLAKSLVAKWKKLVPTPSAERPGNTKDVRTHAHPRSSEGADVSREHVRELSPEEPPHVEEDEEEEMMEEERGYRTNYSPSPPQHHYSPPQLSHGSQRGGYQSEGYESPMEEEQEPAPSPPRKEVRHAKPLKEPGREHHGSHGDRDEERRRRHAQASGGGGGGSGGEGKKSSVEKEPQHSGKASKHSRHSTQHERKKDKRGGSDGRSREPRDSSILAQAPEEQAEEAFDTPTMSFESFLTYDAPTPTKKKKKPGSSSRPSSHHHTPPRPPVQPSSAGPSSSKESKPSKANGSRSKKADPAQTPRATTPVPEKRRRVVEVVSTLPDIPLPAIQPYYRPLPSIDLTPLSPQRRKGPVSNDAEEDTGFTGRRFNSKMTVYSGSKTSYLPKMMSLYEQCIRVLQNNIDSIDEVGGVPFEILEPVLERCTPEQLYRIEQCNQCFMEDSDELWQRHCQRDFKGETPQEYESWREMYLRKHDEREERLRKLTQNISSAHANKPKGRQVKMAFVNSVAKPPRDVRRRQEKFGTTSTSTASSTAAAAPIKRTHSFRDARVARGPYVKQEKQETAAKDFPVFNLTTG
ncbi:elongin-A-like isoform X2 [Coregonus clupeaformis]|uniref:elongin-A-like isoform X2 n=1 Tax=Coregonus clupeaformis TaxID=59861 RepID=UPI001BDFE530|nr:elongin-A-like isoform X2 [Coregonus clupeaformis]